MSRTWWIVVVLVAIGVGLAVLVGVLGTRNEPTKSEAASSLCGSLTALDASVKTLTSIDTSTATMSDFQADVTAVQNDWNQVESDAQALKSAEAGSLDSAWASFESAVKGIPSDATDQDASNSVKQAAGELQSSVESTMSSASCSGASA